MMTNHGLFARVNHLLERGFLVSKENNSIVTTMIQLLCDDLVVKWMGDEACGGVKQAETHGR